MDEQKLRLVAEVVGGVAVSAGIGYFVWRSLKKPKKKQYPKDTVVLHFTRRGPNIPSFVPFAVKLETFLRFANIPYECVHSRDRSKKGKFPWIEYNGEEIADSEFCIEFLNERLGINLNKTFSPPELGIARAFQKMFEENTYWVLIMDRWVFDEDLNILKGAPISFVTAYFLVRRLKNMAYAQGMGRHSRDEVHHIFEKDVKAFSDFLGSKRFMLGDNPCQEDCAVFGQLSQFYWQSFGSKSGEIIRKYKNVCEYCERMKTKFWSDWDKCITNGSTK